MSHDNEVMTQGGLILTIFELKRDHQLRKRSLQFRQRVSTILKNIGDSVLLLVAG